MAQGQGISEEVLKGWIEAFKMIDNDGTGQIEPHELNRVFLKCGE